MELTCLTLVEIGLSPSLIDNGVLVAQKLSNVQLELG